MSDTSRKEPVKNSMVGPGRGVPLQRSHHPVVRAFSHTLGLCAHTSMGATTSKDDKSKRLQAVATSNNSIPDYFDTIPIVRNYYETFVSECMAFSSSNARAYAQLIFLSNRRSGFKFYRTLTTER
jgi:hypothetical protein